MEKCKQALTPMTSEAQTVCVTVNDPNQTFILVYFYQLGVIYILRVTFGASKKVGFYFRMHVSISKTIFSHLSANSFEKKVVIMYFIYL